MSTPTNPIWRSFCRFMDLGENEGHGYCTETTSYEEDYQRCCSDAKLDVPKAVAMMTEFAKWKLTQ